jgi:hypothetical protein
MLRSRLALLGLVLLATPAAANPFAPSPDPYDVYIERQRGTTVTLEHTPLPRRATVVRRSRVATVRPARPRAAMRRAAQKRVVKRVRTYRYSGIAGGCRDGGHVRRVVAGQPVLLQREVCHNIDIRLTGPYVVR